MTTENRKKISQIIFLLGIVALIIGGGSISSRIFSAICIISYFFLSPRKPDFFKKG